MARPALELADVFRLHGDEYRKNHHLTGGQLRAMRAIEQCRTARLGGHVRECDKCGHREVSYNSCRNRHCPKCQSLARAKWLEEQQEQLLPVHYFHVVFTVPEEIARISLQNKREVYNILFRAASATLQRIAADPKHLGAEIGFLAVLHTWGQNLREHPHLHCVVPGGGLSPDGQRWIRCRPNFFLSVKVLSQLFRGLFLHYLRKAYQTGRIEFHGRLEHLRQKSEFERLVQRLRSKKWVVYAKRPFGGPAQVLAYLGRYTHRVAISNSRLVSIEDGRVRFSWKDYRDGNTGKVMMLEADEFIRRFLLHVLPDGFMRIRHFGLLSNCHREEKLELCRSLLEAEEQSEAVEPGEHQKTTEQLLPDNNNDLCPECKQGRLHVIETIQSAFEAAAQADTS
jgi:putative transposase/transposase-like zinc-binding protein